MKETDILQIVMLISLIVASGTGFNSLSYGRGGGETLDSGEAMKRKVSAIEGDQVEFRYEAESAPVECGIIYFGDDEDAAVPVNITLYPPSCLYYDYGMNGEVSFVIPKSGVWLVVVINISPVNQNVEYEWEGTRQADVVLSYTAGFGTFTFVVIILFVLFIRKKKKRFN